MVSRKGRSMKREKSVVRLTPVKWTMEQYMQLREEAWIKRVSFSEYIRGIVFGQFKQMSEQKKSV